MIDAQISRSIALGIDLEKNLRTIRMGARKTTEDFLVLHQLKEETSHQIIHTANQEVINLTMLLSAEMTNDQRLLLHPTNKSIHKTVTRRHLKKWFVSRQPTLRLVNYQTFAR